MSSLGATAVVAATVAACTVVTLADPTCTIGGADGLLTNVAHYIREVCYHLSQALPTIHVVNFEVLGISVITVEWPHPNTFATVVASFAVLLVITAVIAAICDACISQRIYARNRKRNYQHREE